MDWLRGKKTHIIAGLMVLGSIVKLVTGDMGFAEFFSSNDINTLLQGFGLSALRASVAKTEIK